MEILINSNVDEKVFTTEYKELLKKVVNHVVKEEGSEEAQEVSFLITDNDEIKNLNREYRDKDMATDVLSFPMDEKILGDIVISMDKVFEQAEEYGHSNERELAFLTVHGMLHLLGHDHIEEDDRQKMRTREKELLDQLGIHRD